MSGFVGDFEEAEELELNLLERDVLDLVRDRTGPSGSPTVGDDVDGIRTFRGLAYGLPIAVGLWGVILGVPALVVSLI